MVADWARVSMAASRPLAAGHGQGADATFERGDPFFEHLLGGFMMRV